MSDDLVTVQMTRAQFEMLQALAIGQTTGLALDRANIHVDVPVSARVGDSVCTGTHRGSLTWETLDSYLNYPLSRQRNDEQWLRDHLSQVGLW